MRDWQSWIDKQISEVIGDGNMAHHAGAGKPLNLGDDELTPADLRLAHKLMKENDLIPPWMQLGQELDADRESLLARVKQYARDYLGRVGDARRANSIILENEAQQRWQNACQRIREDIDAYNRKLLSYNITVPPQIGQRIPLNADTEIKKALG